MNDLLRHSIIEHNNYQIHLKLKNNFTILTNQSCQRLNLSFNLFIQIQKSYLNKYK